MAQTESRSTRQLWKERPVLFLLSLLVLLMEIRVIFTCECQEADWLRAMCPGEDKAVVWGRLISESYAGTISQPEILILHHVKVSKIFKEGFTKLKMSSDETIKMISPKGCSLTHTGDGALYMIYGEPDGGGILHTSICTAELSHGFFEVSGRNNYFSIITGGINPTC